MLGTQKQKRLAISHKPFCKVEAAGIEPASRDISVTASTCVVGSFTPSPLKPPTDGVEEQLVGSLFNPERGQRRPGTIRNL